MLHELYRQNPDTPETACQFVLTTLNSDVTRLVDILIARMGDKASTLVLENEDRIYTTTARFDSDTSAFPVNITIYATNFKTVSASITMPAEAITTLKERLEDH